MRNLGKLPEEDEIDTIGQHLGRSPGSRGMNRLSINGIAGNAVNHLAHVDHGFHQVLDLQLIQSSSRISAPVQSAIVVFTK